MKIYKNIQKAYSHELLGGDVFRLKKHFFVVSELEYFGHYTIVACRRVNVEYNTFGIASFRAYSPEHELDISNDIELEVYGKMKKVIKFE